MNKTAPYFLITYVLLIYEGVLSTLLLVFQSDRIDSVHYLSINIIIVAFIIGFTLYHVRTKKLQIIFTFFPIALTGFLYAQACALRLLLFPSEIDPLLHKWEIALFGTEWYRVFASLPVFILELFHGFYFFYYIALFLFAALAWKAKPQLVTQYIFVLVFSSCLHNIALLLFPASGPVYLRESTMPDGFVFIPIMNWIYTNLDQGGGAFPSQHAASTMILSLFAQRLNPGNRRIIVVLALGILLSTVVGSFHYAVDVLAGILTGSLAYILGNWLFLHSCHEKT